MTPGKLFHELLGLGMNWEMAESRFDLFSRESFLSADNGRQGAEGIVHRLGVRKHLGRVWLQNHHVCAAMVAPEILAAHAAR